MATKVVLPAWRLEQLRAAAVNTAESQDSVNKPPELTQKKKDRHRPGYMAEYMRQYRKRKRDSIDQA